MSWENPRWHQVAWCYECPNCIINSDTRDYVCISMRRDLPKEFSEGQLDFPEWCPLPKLIRTEGKNEEKPDKEL